MPDQVVGVSQMADVGVSMPYSFNDTKAPSASPVTDNFRIGRNVNPPITTFRRSLPIVFAAATGLRPSELFGLERHDVDRDAGVIYVRRA